MTTSNAALLRAISDDRALGSAMLFGHRHEVESPRFHVEIMDLWRCQDEFVLIEAFREGAKTTLAEEFLLMEGAFGNFFYCILFGETYDKACQKIEAMAHEAKTNHKFVKLFGNVLARKPTENKLWFSSGSLIQGVGWEQEITGMKYLGHRPDRAYLDDIENLERVRSAAAVDGTMEKIRRELVPAMDKSRRRIRITQTPRATDSMCTRLRANSDWVCRAFPICNGDPDDPATVSAWPARFPMDWVRNERDSFERAGMLRFFQQEYMLNVESLASKPFIEDMLRFTDLAPAAWLPRYAIYDPARTVSVEKSDRTGKVVVSRLGSKIIVHESGGFFWQPDQIRTDVFATWARHHCAGIGIEKNSLDEFLLQPIRFEMTRRGVLFMVTPLQAPQDRNKESFIMGLHPFFSAGDIVLVGGRGAHAQLVAEILNFPGGRMDILNALAYSLRMFAGQPVYEDFGEANIGPAPTVAAGDTVYVAWNATPAETVCVALIRHGRHLFVARDWAVAGPITDAIRATTTELRASFPRARFETYVPAELMDSQQRVALVPALRMERVSPWRGETTSLARGALADKLRTTIRERRLLTVDAQAPLTLAALAADYKYPVAGSGKQAHEPAPGLSRLIAEAIECCVAMLDKGLDNNEVTGGNFSYNAQGVRYRTALPRRT